MPPIVEAALDAGRKTKHRAFVGWKRARLAWSFRSEPRHRDRFARRPYVYREDDFASLALGPIPDPGPARRDPVDRVIYTFWTGDNPITPNRARSLDQLRRLNEPEGIDVLLITPSNLGEYLAPEVPLSDLYDRLHVVHRADYLRAYFLHVHGGGYADIKCPVTHWRGAFDRMDASTAWMMSDFEPSRFFSPAFADRRLERLLQRTSPTHLHQIAFIARKATPLSTQWWEMVQAKLEAHREQLTRHPGVGRDGGENYPLPWTGILGQIIDPLAVKYADHVIHDRSMELLQSDYL